MPVIGNLVKGICRRAVERVFEDVKAITMQLSKGAKLEDVLPEAGIKLHTNLSSDHRQAAFNTTPCLLVTNGQNYCK